MTMEIKYLHQQSSRESLGQRIVCWYSARIVIPPWSVLGGLYYALHGTDCVPGIESTSVPKGERQKHRGRPTGTTRRENAMQYTRVPMTS